MAPLRIPEDPHTSVKDMIAFLQWLPTIVKKDNAPFVYPYPISMADGREKRKWMDELEAAEAVDVKTVEQFFTESKRGKNCALALGLMPTTNPVTDGQRNIENHAWHAFAIAWIKTTDRSRVLIISDPEPTDSDSNRSVHLLRSTQVKLYEVARSKCKKTALYYNANRKYWGKEQCLRRSFEKLKEWIHCGFDDLFGGEDDLRIEECIRVVP